MLRYIHLLVPCVDFSADFSAVQRGQESRRQSIEQRSRRRRRPKQGLQGRLFHALRPGHCGLLKGNKSSFLSFRLPSARRYRAARFASTLSLLCCTIVGACAHKQRHVLAAPYFCTLFRMECRAELTRLCLRRSFLLLPFPPLLFPGFNYLAVRAVPASSSFSRCILILSLNFVRLRCCGTWVVLLRACPLLPSCAAPHAVRCVSFAHERGKTNA